MEAGERNPDERSAFPLALRRGDPGAPPTLEIELDRRLDFIPILPPAPIRERGKLRLGDGARRFMPGLMTGALLTILFVAIMADGRDQDRIPPQRLIAGATGPLEPREVPFNRERAEVDTDIRDVPPRSAKVAVREKGKAASQDRARRTRVVLAAQDPASSEPERGNSTVGSGSSKKSTSSGKKPSSPTAEKAPPQPSQSLYHLYKGGKKNDHWFTTSPTERDERIGRGYELVDVEGFVFAKEQPGTVVLSTDNGPAGYIYEKPRDGYIPLYMFRGYNGYGDLFTSDEERIPEYEEQGWNPFGVFGYVLPAR